jgi:hypothetical protein
VLVDDTPATSPFDRYAAVSLRDPDAIDKLVAVCRPPEALTTPVSDTQTTTEARVNNAGKAQPETSSSRRLLWGLAAAAALAVLGGLVIASSGGGDDDTAGGTETTMSTSTTDTTLPGDSTVPESPNTQPETATAAGVSLLAVGARSARGDRLTGDVTLGGDTQTCFAYNLIPSDVSETVTFNLEGRYSVLAVTLGIDESGAVSGVDPPDGAFAEITFTESGFAQALSPSPVSIDLGDPQFVEVDVAGVSRLSVELMRGFTGGRLGQDSIDIAIAMCDGRLR